MIFTHVKNLILLEKNSFGLDTELGIFRYKSPILYLNGGCLCQDWVLRRVRTVCRDLDGSRPTVKNRSTGLYVPSPKVGYRTSVLLL